MQRTTRNGWYWSGDLGYVDDDGWVYFAGRTSDWLRVDGENFPATPIEAIIGRHPDLLLASVYGVPEPDSGDQVMCALVLREGADVRRRLVRRVAGRSAGPEPQVAAALRPRERDVADDADQQGPHPHPGPPEVPLGSGERRPDLRARARKCSFSSLHLAGRSCPAREIRGEGRGEVWDSEGRVPFRLEEVVLRQPALNVAARLEESKQVIDPVDDRAELPTAADRLLPGVQRLIGRHRQAVARRSQPEEHPSAIRKGPGHVRANRPTRAGRVSGSCRRRHGGGPRTPSMARRPRRASGG